jgi:undecaprenyl-diphosphatase
VALAGCVAGFFVLLVMVVTGRGVVVLDHRVAEQVRGLHGRAYLFGKHLTDVVSPIVDAVVVGVTGVVMSLRRLRWAPVLTAGWAIGLTGVTVLAVKYGVARPTVTGQHVTKGEFPSGHTASALVMLGTVALLLCRDRLRVWAMSAVVALTCLVGACLVYDRFHWLSDVLASLLIGPVLLWLVTRTPAFAAHERYERWRGATGLPPGARPSDAETPADDLLHDLGGAAVDRLHP